MLIKIASIIKTVFRYYPFAISKLYIAFRALIDKNEYYRTFACCRLLVHLPEPMSEVVC